MFVVGYGDEMQFVAGKNAAYVAELQTTDYIGNCWWSAWKGFRVDFFLRHSWASVPAQSQIGQCGGEIAITW